MTHKEIKKEIGIGVVRNASGDGFAICDILVALCEEERNPS